MSKSSEEKLKRSIERLKKRKSMFKSTTNKLEYMHCQCLNSLETFKLMFDKDSVIKKLMIKIEDEVKEGIEINANVCSGGKVTAYSYTTKSKQEEIVLDIKVHKWDTIVVSIRPVDNSETLSLAWVTAIWS